MDPLPFALVVASAFSHASWNVLAKRGEDKESFMLLMTLTSFFTLLPVFYFILPDWRLPLSAVPYMAVSGVAETLYFVSLSRAYELGDLSVVYPLARSSPLFLTILAVAFLGERISAWGAGGILLMLLGVYTIHLRSFSPDDLLLPLRSLGDRPSQFALLTALWTTAYSLSDKVGVTKVNPLIYAFWLEAFILLPMTPVVLHRRGWSTIAREWRESRIQATVAGFLMRFGYVLVLVAMSLMQVSYILALRQLSVVLGAAAGVFLLKERYGRVRLLSSVIMFIGVYILAVLA
jgi:drug/metabolite transporter (DMT)-like permease